MGCARLATAVTSPAEKTTTALVNKRATVHVPRRAISEWCIFLLLSIFSYTGRVCSKRRSSLRAHSAEIASNVPRKPGIRPGGLSASPTQETTDYTVARLLLPSLSIPHFGSRILERYHERADRRQAPAGRAVPASGRTLRIRSSIFAPANCLAPAASDPPAASPSAVLPLTGLLTRTVVLSRWVSHCPTSG